MDEKSAILQAEGDILTSSVSELRTRLKTAAAQGAYEIVIDLVKTRVIDPAGVALLMAAHNTLANRGGKLKLIHVPPDLHVVLKSLRLDQRIEISE